MQVLLAASALGSLFPFALAFAFPLGPESAVTPGCAPKSCSESESMIAEMWLVLGPTHWRRRRQTATIADSCCESTQSLLRRIMLLIVADAADDDFEGDYEAKSKKERELEEREKGPIVPLGPEFCRASGSQCRHFAHEKW